MKVYSGKKANDMKRRISLNVVQIKERLAEAARRAERNGSDIILLGASKNRSAEEVMDAYDAGVEVFGENRVQELTGKRALVNRDARWHFIGHLQRNKVKDVVGVVELIHSVDSRKLAVEINRRACEKGVVQPVLMQLNIAGEDSKYGMGIDEVRPFMDDMFDLGNIELKGLSTVAPFVEDSEEVRWVFQRMKAFMDELREETGAGLTELSMGMTGDFEVAVEEGATIVRIGKGVFGP